MRIRRRALLLVTLGLLAPAAGLAQMPTGEVQRPRAVGVGHQQRVAGGVFARDGKCFFTGGQDRTLRAWNVDNGQQLFLLGKQEASINAVVLGGDNLLISGGEDGSLLLWDIRERRRVGQLPRQEQPIQALAVSPDGKVLAMGAGTWNKPLPGELRLWNLENRTLLAQLQGHRKQILGLAFAPDGRTLAATDRSGDVKLWDLATRQATTFHEPKMPWSVQYAPDGKWLALGEAWGQIRILDAATLSDDSVTRAHKGGVFCLAYSPRGNLLASGGYDGSIRLWNPAALEDQPPVPLGTHKGIIWTLAFSPDGGTLASGGADGLVKFWSIPPALANRLARPAPSSAKTATEARRGRPARLALVASQDPATRNLQDLALAKLAGSPHLDLLDRSTVHRLLREQALSLSGLVDANTAVRAGKILAVDLLAVIESTGTTGQNSGVVIFDAATGARLLDAGFTSTALEPQVLQVAAGVRAAAAQWQEGPKSLKTICFLPVRNADLPRGMDRFCEALAAGLQRALLASGSVTVLERQRLDRLNQEKTLVHDAVTRDLLASVVLVAMDVGRRPQGGIRATVALRDNSGRELKRLHAEVADPNGAGLLPPLAQQVRQALQATAVSVSSSRNRESRRFLRDAQLLWQHKNYEEGLSAAEAAFALRPGEEARMLLTEYLLGYATELIHPGGMRSVGWGLKYKVTPPKLAEALLLAERALLLIDTARAALPDPNDSYELWRSVEPFAVIDSQRIFFNKLPGITLVPADPDVEAELTRFRRFCLQRLVDRCQQAAKDADRDPKALARYTGALVGSVENVSQIAPSALAYTETLAGLADSWLKLARHFAGNHVPVDAAATFGKFLGKVNEKTLLPGKPDPAARALSLALLEKAGKFPDPLVRLYATHYQLRLLVKAGRLTPAQAIARHQAMLEEGKRLIDHPPVAPPNPFRVAMYHLLDDAIGSLYLHDKGRSVLVEYFDLCDFMLAHGDVVEEVIRHAVTYGSPSREMNLRALHTIDQALQVTDSPRRRLFDGSVERFKNHVLKPARHAILTKLPDLLKLQLPWDNVKLLASSSNMDATLLLRTVVHEGHLYLFAGGRDPKTNHWLLRLARVSVLGGKPEVIAQVPVNTEERADPTRDYAFWINPEIFVTATAVDNNHLYAGTVADGILVFPLTGGAPRRIGEREGLPSRYVFKLPLVGKTLVAGLDGGYLVAYDLDTGRCDTIVSSRRGEKRSPFDDLGPFRVAQMAADPARQRVLFTLALTSSDDPRAGLWEFSLRTRQFKRLQPSIPEIWSAPVANRIYFYEPEGLLAYDLAADQVLLLHGKVPAAIRIANQSKKQMGSGEKLGDLSVAFPGWTFYPRRLLHHGYLWQGYPFGRRTLDRSKEEFFPSLRDNTWTYAFSATTALEALSARELLIGDYNGLYLVRLKGDGIEPQRSGIR